jgi:hypothetical protein
LPWKQKKGDLKKNGFLSSNFSTTSHGIWYSYKVSLNLIKASPRNVSEKLLSEERKKKNNNNNNNIQLWPSWEVNIWM